MKLAIETATDVCSVALRDGGGRIWEKRKEERGSHSERLFLFVRELMEEHDFGIGDLQAVLLSEGPGSYTGLRIAASAVKGLLYATEVPLRAVNTLASFASAVESGEDGPARIHAVIDARRRHLYHYSFEREEGALTAAGRVEVLTLEKVGNMIRPGDALIGTGLERLDPSAVRGVVTRGSSHISARSLFELEAMPGGENFIRDVEAADFAPRYYSSRQTE